jgi:tryptophan-rich sensory protein
MGKKGMDIPKLVAAVIISHLAGLVGSLATSPSIPTWYASLAKPAFAPPNWVFAPVWLTLYTFIGIGLYWVWNRGLTKKTVPAIRLFAIQLALNAGWSVLFFGLQSPAWAFAEIVVLWAFIALTIWKFYAVDRKAGWIMVPYIVWVTAAAFLNYSIWMLNV